MSREEEIQRQADIIKQQYRKWVGVPDLSNPENLKKGALEIAHQVEEEKNRAEEILNEISANKPDSIRDGYRNFKSNLSNYAKFRYYLGNKENGRAFFSKSEHFEIPLKLDSELRKLKDEIAKLALVYSYQIIKKEKAMPQNTGEDFNSHFKNRKEQTEEESREKDFLSEEKGRQLTTAHAVHEEKNNSISLIIDILDKYLAGDSPEEIINTCKAVAERKKIESNIFASSPSIRRVIKQIEKENELAVKMGRADLHKPEKEIPFYAYLRFMRGNILQKKHNYFRAKHFFISSFFGKSCAQNHSWMQEGIDQNIVQLILNKWREICPTDTDLVLNNYYRSLFASAVFQRTDGYKLLVDLRKDLFGRWINVGRTKQSKMWSLLQTCLDRKRESEAENEKQKEILQINPAELKQQIVDKFGHRNWLVYLFRKIKNYGLRLIIKEIHRRGLRISKKTIDPVTLRIDDWLKNKQ